MKTETILVDPSHIGAFTSSAHPTIRVLDWKFEPAGNDESDHLARAAQLLRTSNVPVAFPTETVYGLGADATRSDAVRGIYAAKQRPSDNPLIVHFGSLKQLQSYLTTQIPNIYHSLFEKFWPGPLTILLPLPSPSPFAPEVSAGLSTFGARIPRSAIALALLQLADRPIAAPSANASTKPSPTAAEHVSEDLHGRIELIVDGGPCDVGVESTVVDGLSHPPAILRPGGISLRQLRECEGWEGCVIGYKDKAESNEETGNGQGPRAPGMKYRHYSPRARVVLHEHGSQPPTLKGFSSIGIVRTGYWSREGVTWSDANAANGHVEYGTLRTIQNSGAETSSLNEELAASHDTADKTDSLRTVLMQPPPKPQCFILHADDGESDIEIWDVDLGPELDGIARGLFSALRELDRKNVRVIYVEGIDDRLGELAGAIMNRLRKASSLQVGSTQV